MPSILLVVSDIAPFEALHTDSELSEMARQLKSLNDETRVVMEASGDYHALVAKLLYQFMDRKRAEGKPYRVNTMASANKFCGSTTPAWKPIWSRWNAPPDLAITHWLAVVSFWDAKRLILARPFCTPRCLEISTRLFLAVFSWYEKSQPADWLQIFFFPLFHSR